MRIGSGRFLDDRTGHHDRIFHAMDDLFVGRTHSGQNTSQFRRFASYKIIRRQSRPSCHRPDLSGRSIKIFDLELPAFMKFLQHMWSMRKRRERRLESGGPFMLRQVMADRDSTAAPGQFGKS